MLELLGNGRAKFIAYEENVLKFEAGNLGYQDAFTVVNVLKEGELWFAVNKSVDDRTVSAYQEALDRVKDLPEVRKKLKSQFGFTPAKKAKSLFPDSRW